MYEFKNLWNIKPIRHNICFYEALKFDQFQYLKSYGIESLIETGSRCQIDANSFRGDIMIMSEHGDALCPIHDMRVPFAREPF